MAKFKVGDKVRVKKSFVIKGCTLPSMRKYAGITGTITEEEFGDCMIDSTGNLWWNVDSIEFVTEAEQPRREFIVIRRDGAKTIAELRHDREVIKSGKAICNASDTFDFEAGAKIAFDRPMWRKESKKESYIEREFKIGDRVITSRGVGEVVDVDHNETSMPYRILYDKGYKYWSNSGTAKPAPQPAHRFKVGDRVVIKETGKIGEVSAISNDCCPYLVFHEDGKHSGDGFEVNIAKPEHKERCSWFTEYNLAPAPEPPKYIPKIGDRVATVHGNGTVVVIGESATGVWHDNWSGGHDFDILHKDMGFSGCRGWNYSTTNIKLLSGASDV